MDYTVTPFDAITPKVSAARAAFAADRTRPLSWRRHTLERMLRLFEEREERLLDALAADLGKPRIEGWTSEVGFITGEINYTLAHLSNWMQPERVPTPITLKPGASHIVPEPLGVACIIAPWNYPVNMLFAPMVAAIAAGNAVVAKPSELAPHAAAEIASLIDALDDPAVTVVLGGVAETTELLAQRFDHIFYTGNSRVARIVMKAAAEHLTPVTLELGGKSPAIISKNANIRVAARRVAWGKFINAGQTCIAPDYVLVERSVHDEFVSSVGNSIAEFYGDDPQASGDYARIVNEPHFHRLEKMLDSATVAYGGISDVDTRYMAPTVLTGVTGDDPVMSEEIFGPILPVIAVDSLDEAIAFVKRRTDQGAKPLALYSFSESDDENDKVIASTISGGACVNGTLFHFVNPSLPFGGTGESGMGSYHGRFGFDTFSHRRGIMSRSTRIDPPMTYPPFTPKKQKLVRKGLSMRDPRDIASKLRGALRRD